jgi:hypothetical protein
MTDHPEWVWKLAAEVLNAERADNPWRSDTRTSTMRAVASLIAKHEQPPVDPDMEVVNVVLNAYERERGHADGVNAALADYKALMASRT